MAANRTYVDAVTARLTPMGPVTARAMFGGFGIYLDGRMFGIVASGILYFRVDDITRGDYEEAGSGPFTYDRKGKTVEMNGYWRVPAAVHDDRESLIRWAEQAHDAARRTKSDKKRKP